MLGFPSHDLFLFSFYTVQNCFQQGFGANSQTEGDASKEYDGNGATGKGLGTTPTFRAMGSREIVQV